MRSIWDSVRDIFILALRTDQVYLWLQLWLRSPVPVVVSSYYLKSTSRKIVFANNISETVVLVPVKGICCIAGIK